MSENMKHDLIDFQEYLEKKGASKNTITSCLCAVRQYYLLFGEPTVERLLNYREYLISHYKVNTVNSRINSLNRYIDFISAADKSASIAKLESYRLVAVKTQKKSYLDNVISEKDYILLKQKLKESQDYFWYFVVRFLAATGSRVSELVQIKFEYLCVGYMELCSKGGKVRRIYFPTALCGDAIPWCVSRGIKSGFIFLNKHGVPITPRGIASQLKKKAERYGIDPHTVYPHSFRHRFAKNFLKKFNDISLLADLMGHESVETTRVYLTLSSEEQRDLLDEIVTW